MKRNVMNTLFAIVLMLLGQFLASLIASALMLVTPLASIIGNLGTTAIVIYYTVVMCLVLSVYIFLLQDIKRFKNIFPQVHIAYAGIVCIVFTILFVLSKASLLSPFLSVSTVFGLPFLPALLMIGLFLGTYATIVVIGIVVVYSALFSLLFIRKSFYKLSILIYAGCIALCSFTYLNSPNHKYKNESHGFDYMNGFSSTDLSDYMVYSDSGKLAVLNHEADLILTDYESMPVLDGAEACFPVYSAVAKAIYQDIDDYELEYMNTLNEYEKYTGNGKIVSFYNTAVGFERLLNGDADMFFGAMPSKSQLELAEDMNVELVYTPIGKEAFVFFVNEDNPIDELTSDQIRSIYHGDIGNWKEVGGKNDTIIAFQRPERSGSQSMMIHFMKDISLKEPLTYEMEKAMLGIIKEVAEYHNEAGAIGYSFRYFLEGMNEVDGVKMLSVDGVYPNNDSIKNNLYPVVTTLYCITVKDNPNENVQKVLDFLLSEDGQYLIEKTGYSPLQ